MARFDRVLELWMEQRKKKLTQSDWGFIDSTKLPIGQRVHFIKTMGNGAGIGHSSTGDFYGLKLHVLINEALQICASRITSGNVYDLVPVKEGLLAGQRGRIYADKGYISKEQRFALMGQNLDFLAGPKDNQTYAT